MVLIKKILKKKKKKDQCERDTLTLLSVSLESRTNLSCDRSSPFLWRQKDIFLTRDRKSGQRSLHNASLVAQMVKHLPAMWDTWVQSLCHSSTLAWKIPWMEEPGRLQSRCHKELDKS